MKRSLLVALLGSLLLVACGSPAAPALGDDLGEGETVTMYRPST